jgi:rRNA processing protein Gar1
MPESKEKADVSKMVVGFINDVVGPVNMPMYCIALYKKSRERLEEQMKLIGQTDLK